MIRCVATPASRNMTPGERIRFHAKPDPQTGCWVWPLAPNSAGYGRLTIGGRDFLAHRVSYEAFVGPIPDGLVLDHLCCNPICCNPAHLEPVTTQENSARAAALITSCPRGHRYTPENTVPERNRRTCRTCKRDLGTIARRISRAKAREELAA